MKKLTIGNYIKTAVDAAVLFRNTVKVAGSQEGFFVLPLDGGYSWTKSLI